MKTATKLQPIADRIIVKRDAAEETTKSGIVIPDAAKEKKSRGRVVAIGSGRLLDDGTRSPLEVREGDCVVFDSYAGSEIEHDGEKFVILSEHQVLAVIQS